jgi:Na+-transporting methylmalonyl-CoA/oxaloacetate decarboxylase gamma subunit
MNTLTQGLLITLIGMGLVFLAIVLLWGMMALMVRLGSKPEESSSEQSSAEVQDNQPETPDRSQDMKKRLAAAAAVAYALTRKAKDSQSVEKLSGLSGNAWQTTQRAQVLQGKANIFTSRSTRR